MWNGIYKCAALILILVYGLSCTTGMVWDATNPRDYASVKDPALTLEQIKEQGISYKLDGETGRLYVEKGPMRKSRDYLLRTIATPITLTVDGVVLVANVAIWAAAVAISIPIGIVLYIMDDEKESEDLEQPQDTALDPEASERSLLDHESLAIQSIWVG